MNRFSIFFLFVISSLLLRAQAPPYIPYQAIARDLSGQIKANSPIQVEFKIYNTMMASGTSYDEVHAVTTNDFGYFNLRIGAGTIQSGSFSSINWQTGDVSYEVWVDMGLGFTPLGGRTGFLSVPYAMYAANSNPNPTLTINAPNTVSNTLPATYSIHVPTPSLSVSGNSISISNGNTVPLPEYVQGAGISISGGTITNTAPDQTVNIAGADVTGAYPNFTINPGATTTITSGNNNIVVSGAAPNITLTSIPSLSIAADQLSISNGNAVTLPTTSITQGAHVMVDGTSSSYTISAVTPTLTGTGNASVNGTYPNQTIDVPAQTLSISGNTINLSSGGGNVVLPQAPVTAIDQGPNVTVNGTSPNFTISAVTPTLTGTGNASVNGTYPNQTIDVPAQTLSISGNTINLSSGGGNVVLPQSPVTTITQSTNIVISGASPNYTVSSPSQSLSISGNTLNLSAGGGSVTLPSTPTTTITQGSNVMVSGTAPNYTISSPSQILSIVGNTLNLSDGGGSVTLPSTPTTTITQGPNVTVSGTAPNYTISANTQTTSIAPGANISVTGTAPNYTISSPSQSLSISGNTLSLSAGGGSVVVQPSWGLSGNAGTTPATNFLGTTDANALVLRTDNTERMRVTSTGNIAIGTTAPAANFDINAGNIKLGATSRPFSSIRYGAVTASMLLTLGNNESTVAIPGALTGDVVVVTLNDHNLSPGSVSLNNAYISSNGTMTFNVNASTGLLVNLEFSYILMRP